MTTLADRPNSALLVIDVQTGVVAQAYRRDETVRNIVTLVDKARQAGTDVVWVQHSGEHLAIDSDAWQIVAELEPHDGEAIVRKRFGDAFEDTDLEDVLAAKGVGRLVVSGAQSDECIRSTIHGAFTRGYDVTLVEDAHTTEDLTEYGAPTPDKVVSHTNLYWRYQSAPGRTAGTVTTAEADLSRP